MKEQILELEKIALQLEPGEKARKAWMTRVDAYGQQFLNEVDELPAWVESLTKSRELLDMPIGEEGRSMDELLEALGEYVDKPGLNPASGGHLAYIPGGGLYPSAMADYLAAITNRYAGLFYSGPGAVRIENQLIRWMCKLMGYPENALGNLASGGSVATLTAIATARDYMQVKASEVERSVIYLSAQVHHCVQKAIRIAGLGEAVLRYVPLDERFRLNPRALEQQIEADKAAGLRPFLLVATVGTTDTGAVDPLEDLADIASRHQLWMHADAAYGGFFVLVDELKDKFRGIERTDSITIDPHKGLFLPYGLGAVLVKNTEALRNTHYYKANYMQDALSEQEESSPADHSPELTKHFRGLRMWLPLQLFGLKPFRAGLQEKVLLTRYFYEKVQELGFETGPYPELSVMTFRYIPELGDANAFNAALIEAVKEDGRVFLSSTTINGAFWIRLAVLSFRTHLHTINLCLEVLKSSLQRVKAEMNARIV